MINVKNVLDRARPLVAAGTLLLAVSLTAVAPWQSAGAAALTDRSLQVTSSVPSDLSTSAAPGNPNNGNAVGHKYIFTAGTADTILAIEFGAWDSAFGFAGGGTAPLGFTAAGVATQSVTVENITSGAPAVTFTGASTAANRWSVSHASGVSATPGQVIEVTFGNHFVNPSSTYEDDAFSQSTYFVHITTHDTQVFTPGSYAPGESYHSATAIDSGTVTNAVVPSIDINTRVQETLRFSVEGVAKVGLTDDGNGIGGGPSVIAAPTDRGVNTCDPLTNATTSINMGDTNNALDTSRAYHAASYFRLATNSTNGAIVYYSGEVLRSGSNAIAHTAPTFTSADGNVQFGLAFDGTTEGHNDLTHLTAEADYAGLDDADNDFAFVPFTTVGSLTGAGAPVPLASSIGVVSCDTGAIRYVANISEDTPAGIYTTRINYIASPSY